MFEQDPSAQKAYTSLANKYRPQTFEEVVGQDSVSKTLMNAIKSGRISHAYLFYGPRGCGKTTSARLLAKALNCTGGEDPTKPNPHPCGVCPQCIEIAASSDLDVLELDAASNTQVEKVREAIIETVSLAAGRDRFKVFILDEVHMLSTSSFNALLKTIEEPPAHVVFILATTELHKVPLTISSRCQTFRFKPINDKQTEEHLMDLAEAEGIELEQSAAEIIARNAGGAMRDALTILDRAIAFSGTKITEAGLSEMLGLLPKELVEKAAVAVVNKDAQELHKIFENIKQEGFDSLGLLKDLKKAFGDIFYFSLKAAPEPFEVAADLLAKTSPAFVAGLTRKISKLIDEVRFSDTPLLSAEVGLFTIMESSLDLEQFISRLTDLENALGGVEDTVSEKKTLNKISAPPVTKIEPILPEKEAKTAKQQDKEDEAAALSGAAAAPAFDERVKWEEFKKELSGKFPFLYQNILDADISFLSPDCWELSYPADDDFAMGSVKRRTSDLEAIAKHVCNTKINFSFKLDEGRKSEHVYEVKRPTVSYTPKPAPQPVKKEAPATVAASTAVKIKEVISSEEPFLAGDYSSDLAASTPAAAVSSSTAKAAAPAAEKQEVYSTTATDTAKKLLQVIDGTIVEGF